MGYRKDPHLALCAPHLMAFARWAVMLVFVFHTGPTLFPAGRIGVDIFFVLSGYLITSILLTEQKRTRRSGYHDSRQEAATTADIEARRSYSGGLRVWCWWRGMVSHQESTMARIPGDG